MGTMGQASGFGPSRGLSGTVRSYMNDRYTENDGQTIYFTLSLWDPYNVFWFKASLEK